jgi:hypothetical protein
LLNGHIACHLLLLSPSAKAQPWFTLDERLVQRLPSRDLARPDDTPPFHHFKSCAHNKCIVTDPRFVHESNRRMGAATGQNGIVGTIDEFDPQILTVTTTDPKMRTVMGLTVV